MQICLLCFFPHSRYSAEFISFREMLPEKSGRLPSFWAIWMIAIRVSGRFLKTPSGKVLSVMNDWCGSWNTFKGRVVNRRVKKNRVNRRLVKVKTDKNHIWLITFLWSKNPTTSITVQSKLANIKWWLWWWWCGDSRSYQNHIKFETPTHTHTKFIREKGQSHD